MKRLLLLGMTALLLTGCSVEDDDYRLLQLMSSQSDKEADEYEGIWSIDGTPLPSTYTVMLSRGYIMFNTFPYYDVLERLIGGLTMPMQTKVYQLKEELADYNVTEPDRTVFLPYTSVGQSDYSTYNELIPATADNSYQVITFGLSKDDGQQLTVSFDLVANLSTIVSTANELTCILTIGQLTITDSDGEQYHKVRGCQLTFTSTKKTK